LEPGCIEAFEFGYLKHKQIMNTQTRQKPDLQAGIGFHDSLVIANRQARLTQLQPARPTPAKLAHHADCQVVQFGGTVGCR
jgi:hypothetical protein